jgi:hypothetical protein
VRFGSNQVDTWAEVAVGLTVIGLVLSAGGWGWRFYDAQIRPYARAVPTFTPTPSVDPETAKEQGRRIRLVLDHVGAGNGFRAANRPDLAAKEYLEALAVDPDNFEARQNLREMGVQLPASANERTPTPVPATPRPTVTVRP